jgi:hypothetical protein
MVQRVLMRLKGFNLDGFDHLNRNYFGSTDALGKGSVNELTFGGRDRMLVDDSI